MLERGVCARLEVSGSNFGLRKYAYLVKKMYLNSRGVCGGGLLAGIFFPFAVLKFSSIFSFSRKLFVGACTLQNNF